VKPITKLSQLDLTKRYSYADYLTWHFQERVELIRGWIQKMSPAPGTNHQSVSRTIQGEMYNFFKKNPCQFFDAPFDVRLLDKKKSKQDQEVNTVVQPDLCVICDAKKIDDRGCIGAPDLIVEIVSPGNSKREMKTKYELYEENGVREYWIANPLEKNIMLYILKAKKYQLSKIYFDDDTIESVLFKGLRIELKEIFN
jgi:Uma2 family endonuclease